MSFVSLFFLCFSFYFCVFCFGFCFQLIVIVTAMVHGMRAYLRLTTQVCRQQLVSVQLVHVHHPMHLNGLAK